MNSKKKNKNRPKPPKIPQKLSPIESDKPESVENITTKIELESEKKEDFVAAPTVSNVEISKDEKIQIEETPKKPERGKGKKKPQCDKIQDDNIVESKLLVVDDKPDEQELLIDDAQEYLAVTSKTRKKKNKDKKQIDIQETSKIGIDNIVKLDSNEDIEIIQVVRDSVANPPQSDKIQESNTKIMKKKKKKRNRHDSEKSNVIESIESEKESLCHGKDIFSTVTLIDDCNIVESTQSKCDTDISVDKGVKRTEEMSKETTIVQNLNPAEEEENLKNKKLNKKHKQLQQKADDLITKNEIILLSEEGKQETDCLESCESLSLGELTSKSQVAKSIDRKRKVKPGKQLTTSDKQDQTISSKTTTLDNADSENKIVDTKEQANIGQIIPPILDVEKQEEKLCTVLDKVLVDDNQSAESVDDFSDNTFREVKSAKKKKKQGQKNIELLKGHSDAEVTKTEIISTLQLDQNIAEKSKQEPKNLSDESLLSSQVREEFQNKVATDETEKSIVDIPDIIQYPRSASQQLFGDSNNNTIIKEITPTKEINLEIPICTSVPTIQGSGETPENKLQQDPLRVNLTEIDSKLDKCIKEKTDIKSKMMEVNQDMEELRLSIERSLAELTALDKGDKEFEKKIQDKKLSIDDNRKFKQEVKESETAMTFLMPSFLVDKPATSVEDLESVKPKNLHICISPEKEITFPNVEDKVEEAKTIEYSVAPTIPPVCPSRKDNKGKGKSKKKSKQESTSSTASCTSSQITSDTKAEEHSSTKKETGKSDEAQKETQNKGKQQSLAADTENNVPLTDSIPHTILALNLEPIEKFEDALTSSVDDVNQTFEMIASEATAFHQNFDNPQINIIAPTEDEGKEKNVKENPVTPPKNLLGHPDIPVPSNKTDYKKEKNKTPNSQQAKVKIKDSADIEKTEKISKQSQTYNKRNNLKNLNGSESFSYMTNGNNEFIYKYSFRKVYLQNFCIICKKELMQRFPCKFCSLVFYCSQKHVDEDWPQHQPLCFAVSTISHLKDQKHIYADAKSITGQDFRVLRMQMIVSCEKILKRKLVPWEQEALLYPRICADINCREWKQFKLKDCEGCEQISYCSDHADHLPVDHTRWCKSYALYQKLVNYQQTKGRLEPPMPTKILETPVIPGKLNEVLASMYEEKIDMNDIQYAALTQLATSPLTVAYSYQLFTSNVNFATNILPKKTTFTVHVVGAELQFEADGLNKWEVFLLHLRPDIKDLRIVLIGPDLNPSNLPLDLLGKVTLCENCKTNRRRVIFSFHDKLTYHEYYTSDDFILPDIVCAFNLSIQRSSIYNGRDSWPSTIKCILKQKVPFVVTAYSLEELQRDLGRVKEFGDFNTISEAKHNPFASMRPDRNFITDHEIPLLFKNYCLGIVCAI